VAAGGITIVPLLLDWLQLAEHELLLFVSFWFIVSMIDEVAIDAIWAWRG